LLFGFDCCSPTEATLLPNKSPTATNITDYHEQMVLSLSSAQKLAMKSNQNA